MVSTHRYCHARRQQTGGALPGGVQGEQGDVQYPRRTLTGMNNFYGTPAGGYGSTPAGTPSPTPSARKKRRFRWGAGVTLVGFIVGGGIAWAATSGGGASAASGPTGTAAVLNSA